MKGVTKTNNILSPDYDKSYCNEMDSKTLLMFDSEPGYYQVISPMLAPGHENELICWLKSFGLIKSEQICKKAIKSKNCSHMMRWKSTKDEDLYQWQCSGCLGRRSIRNESIFDGANCSFRNAIRILLAWCKGYDIETVANMLVKSPTKSSSSIPQKYWLEILPCFDMNNMEQILDQKRHILKTIETLVLPGSILITPFSSTLCSYDDFECLRTLYPTIVSTRDLARHDDGERTLSSNMETIWKSVLDVCEFAQFYNSSHIQQFIISHMWRSRYTEEAFELLLYELSFMQ
ncbi:hypothetical protein NQ314_004809 [Rhamnusium bicolor]|uniref:Uncharacterized protein n=1 Tax=Rhamnusium bicolor TaxID=1586634 RepID=A0AAV8ZKW1_9CUCU|nr:hypothetical protein NQ314_004809 [Rhamnusium bicolor]